MIKYVIAILSSDSKERWLGLSKDGQKLSIWQPDARNIRGQQVLSFESDYAALTYANERPKMIKQLFPSESSWIEVKRIIIF